MLPPHEGNTGKMKTFKNRKFAVLITVIVAIIATLFGVYKSTSRLSKDIEAMFYDGVTLSKEGYVQPSIASHLKSHTDAALNMATILVKYPQLKDDADNVMRLRRELLDAESIGNKSETFRKMSASVNSITQAALKADLSERDAAAVNQYASTITGAETAIRNSAYNQTASMRWSEQSSITRLIGILLPVRQPEFF